ncbi:hypothetical protein PIB30_093032, partial [Stylosanthes scabra]|nr:hypothetical protein [Stylosanthes scabra]
MREKVEKCLLSPPSLLKHASRNSKGQRNDGTVTEVLKTASHEKNHYCPLPRQLGKRKRLLSTLGPQRNT